MQIFWALDLDLTWKRIVRFESVVEENERNECFLRNNGSETVTNEGGGWNELLWGVKGSYSPWEPFQPSFFLNKTYFANSELTVVLFR